MLSICTWTMAKLAAVGALAALLTVMGTSAIKLDGVRSGAVNCSAIRTFPNLDLAKYAGDWHHLMMYPNYPSGDHGLCGKFSYDTIETTRLVGNFSFIWSNDTAHESRVKKAWLEPAHTPGELNSILGPRDFPFSTSYSVLDTDYDSYSVVYSCSWANEGSNDFAFVMTRVAKPPEDLRSRLEVITANLPPILVDRLTDVRESC